ncbi:uncharacterized protein [Lolium perenne]|nr:uncharacterized protein LOC127319750 isoform X4 [Lolium perenne]XP_051205682.1 uncharacterized protein LOC127319750 isoform X5 [Lolium perenne]
MNTAPVAPKPVSLHLLEELTNNFSPDRKLGGGTYGDVYLGEHKNGEKIAVKVLKEGLDLNDEEFQKEYHNLANLQHKNVVRLVGYCHETKKEFLPYNGRVVFVDTIKRMLCFDYMHNGSLDSFIYDEFNDHNWCTRYAIIKGICEGLEYLHEKLKPPMYHLDLKPENILLDENMSPKIADFGVSRLFLEEKTRKTNTALGTLGYIPPEYIKEALISIKFDIFSLGVVIIQIMMGREGYFRSEEMSSQQFVDLVHTDWMNRLQAISVDVYSVQVRRCIEIALSCVEADRHKRPSIGLIVSTLNKTESCLQILDALRNDSASPINQASSSVSKLVDEVQSMAVSAAPSHSQLQQIMSVPKGPGETSTEPFKDRLLKDESNVASNVGNLSMANAQSGPVTPQSQGTEYSLNLYMHQTIHGPNHNQINIADPKQPMLFGYTNVHDYPIHDGLGPSAKIVARAQGLHAETSMNDDDWFHWSSIVFIDERFRGSSFKAIGNQNKIEGQWAIVGGTGVFTFAQGTISIYRIQDNGPSNIKEIRINAFCYTPPQTTASETKPFKDRLLKDESNAASNVGSLSMANAQSGPVTPQSQGTEYSLNLYMHQTIHGPNHNQINIADPKQPMLFGYTNVHDYPIHDGLGPSAKIVARAQGLHAETSMNDDDWFHWSSIVFIDERFRGSSFKAIGNQNKIKGQWAIVGGTGVFTFAQGTISIYRMQDNGPSNTKEIRIRAFCRTPQTTPTKIKPFKDRLLKDESNATSNVGSLSMTNAQSGPVTPQSLGTEYSLNLYMHQTIHGPNHNQINIADPKQPMLFGYTNVHDYPIHDGLGPSAKIVARAQGLHAETSMNGDDWFHWSSIVFIDERFGTFRGSSFKAIGNQNKIEGEWAIVGGTGVFTFAQGTISIYRIQDNEPSNIKEIRINAFCYTTPQATATETK